MLNSDHSKPTTTATIYRITVGCPQHSRHVMYLTLTEEPHMAMGFLNWLGAQLALATGERVYADIVVEADLDELPF